MKRVLAFTVVVAAGCGNHRAPDTVPERLLGQSTAAGPRDVNRPPVDATGAIEVSSGPINGVSPLAQPPITTVPQQAPTPSPNESPPTAQPTAPAGPPPVTPTNPPPPQATPPAADAGVSAPGVFSPPPDAGAAR